MAQKKKKQNNKKTRRDFAPEGVKGVSGIVVEALPNTMFQVLVDETGEQELCFLAGKMRMYRIRVMVGDKVQFERDPYGGKGRIFKRG
jgi:translation initiation factor IF-1